MTDLVGEEIPVKVVYVAFSKALAPMSSHHVVIDKLMKYILDKWTARRTENWLDYQDESVVFGVFGVLVFVNHLGDGMVYTHSKDVRHTKVVGVVDTAEGCAAVQRSFASLEKWAEREPHEDQPREMQSPVAWRSGHGAPLLAGDQPAGRQLGRKGPGVLVDTTLTRSQQGNPGSRGNQQQPGLC